MTDQERAVCLFQAYVKAITSLLNVMGVADTAALLRNSADQLEQNELLLESRRKPRVERMGRA